VAAPQKRVGRPRRRLGASQRVLTPLLGDLLGATVEPSLTHTHNTHTPWTTGFITIYGKGILNMCRDLIPVVCVPLPCLDKHIRDAPLWHDLRARRGEATSLYLLLLVLVLASALSICPISCTTPPLVHANHAPFQVPRTCKSGCSLSHRTNNKTRKNKTRHTHACHQESKTEGIMRQQDKREVLDVQVMSCRTRQVMRCTSMRYTRSCDARRIPHTSCAHKSPMRSQGIDRQRHR
jgi:hypothetical protein